MELKNLVSLLEFCIKRIMLIEKNLGQLGTKIGLTNVFKKGIGMKLSKELKHLTTFV